MKVGRLERHWHKNCLAVGLSQGFIEPLEATALNIVCNTVYRFMESVDADGGFGGEGRDLFNDTVNEEFESVRDYIVAHYVLNSRRDTAYWVQNAQNPNLSTTLRKILDIWVSGQNLSQAIESKQLRSSYTPRSWYCLLAGYGYFPDIKPETAGMETQQKIDMAEVDEFVRRCALNFRTQNELLQFAAGADARSA